MYSLLPGFTSLYFLFVGIFVYLKGRTRTVNITFALLCLTTFVWQGTWSILFQVHDLHIAQFLIKFGYFFIIFLPTFMYHFLSEISESKSELKYVILSYVVDILFALSVIFSNMLFVQGSYAYFWGYYPKAGILHPLHVLQTSLVVSRGLWIVFKKSKQKNTPELLKNQLNYCVAGLLIYFLAAIDYLCNYGIEFYPPGVLFVIISLTILAYAITKHDLFDIRLAIPRTAAFSITLIAFILGYTTILLPYRHFISTQIDLPFIILSIVYVGFGVGLFFERVRLLIQTPLETKFLKGTYNPSQIVKDIASNLYLVQAREEIVQVIGEAFSHNIQIKSLDAVLVNEASTLLDQAIFRVFTFSVRDHKQFATEIVLHGDHQLIRHVEHTTEAILWAEVPTEITQKLAGITVHKGSLIIPLHSPDCFHGFFIIGPKLSEEAYSIQDKTLFSAVVSQVLVVFDRISHQENLKQAFLDLETKNQEISELSQHNQELAEQYKSDRDLAILKAKELSHRASLAGLTMGISHEIRNPLTAIRSNSQLLRDKLLGVDGQDKHPWKLTLSPDSFTAITGSAETSAAVFEWIKSQGFLNDDNQPNLANDDINPYYEPLLFDLPGDLAPFSQAVTTRFAETFKRCMVLDALNLTMASSDRVVRIATSMMQYGASTGISKNLFLKISGFDEAMAEALWLELNQKRYIASLMGLASPPPKWQSHIWSLPLTRRWRWGRWPGLDFQLDCRAFQSIREDKVTKVHAPFKASAIIFHFPVFEYSLVA